MTDTDKKSQLSGGEAIAKTVVANGVDTIFGIPGLQTYGLFEGFRQEPLTVIAPRHEQATAYMAMGYSKSTGKTGVFSVVPGPGALNAGAALCTAMGNCSPVVGLLGEIPSSYLGKGRGYLHELPDQAGTMRSFIKDVVHVDNPAEAPAAVNSVFRLANSGRPGPAIAQMCMDAFDQSQEVELLPGNTEIDQPELDPEQIDAAIKLILKAKKPMIYCGSGALHATEEVNALAELLQAPVTSFRAGRGIVSEQSDLGMGIAAARELWDDVDLVISVGSRCETPYSLWSKDGDDVYQDRPQDGPPLIRIDINPEEMMRFVPDVGIVADSVTACKALVDKLTSQVNPDAGRKEEIRAAKALMDEIMQSQAPHYDYLKAIREVLPEDGFFVSEMTQAGYSAMAGAFPVLKPRSYVSEGFQGTLGFGFPTSLGVKVANPDKAVVSIAGDGGFMFGVQELATAAQYNIGVVAIVFNNNAYGNVRRDQSTYYGGPCGSDLSNPDFVKMAESFGVTGYRVDSAEAFKPVLQKAIDSNRPTLIEVDVSGCQEKSPWRFVVAPEKISSTV